MATKILSELQSTTRMLLQILSGIPSEKINRVPFEGSWTAGQVGDHILKSYGLAETLSGEVKPTLRALDEKVEGIKKSLLDFNIKMKSPEFIIPSNLPVNKEALLSSLEHKISIVSKVVETEDLSVICLDFVIPNLGEMTRLEWVYFMIYHTQRHIHQLKNIITKIA